MIAEGKGVIAPAPKLVSFSDHERRVIFQAAIDLDRYAGAAGGWRRGYSDPLDIPTLGKLEATTATIYVGLLGQEAVRKLAQNHFGDLVLSNDFRRHENGDGGIDLRILTLSLQVKTRKHPTLPTLVRVDNGEGMAVPLTGDAHVFCHIPDRGGFIVRVLGWKWTRDLKRYPSVPAVRGCHFNIEVPDADLEPMSRLWAEIESRRASR